MCFQMLDGSWAAAAAAACGCASVIGKMPAGLGAGMWKCWDQQLL